jgi:hypothetical protein
MLGLKVVRLASLGPLSREKGRSYGEFAGSFMSGRRSREKGARTERSIVNALKASGIGAVRVPLSGAVGGRFAGDVVMPLMGRDLCVEVKARSDGFRELYTWLDNRDVLIVKADRQEALVVVRLSLAAEISRAADPQRGS